MRPRDGTVDFVGGSAHSALAAFPEWRGVKLLCAQAQGMYWFLVMHQKPAPGAATSTWSRAAASARPWAEMGCAGCQPEVGIDLQARDGVTIVPVPGALGPASPGA